MKIRFVTRDESARTLISRPSDEIPRDVTSCNLVERYQRFGGICLLVLKLGEAGSSETFLLIYRIHNPTFCKTMFFKAVGINSYIFYSNWKIS